MALPLTDRKSASKLVFCTGHHADGKDAAPVWSGSLPEDATLVVYMPGRDMARMARELREAGVAEDVACCAISHAATRRQSWVASTVDGLGEMVCGPAPVLLLVGRALASLLIAGGMDARVMAVMASASAAMGEEG